MADEHTQSEDRPAEHMARFEKNVENLLSLWLQSLDMRERIDGLFTDLGESPVGGEDCRVSVNQMIIQSIQEPRYVMLAGSLEAALGDGIAKLEGMLLIESKISLPVDDADWRREAKPAGTGNETGKGREAALNSLRDEGQWANIDKLSKRCHILVGLDGKTKAKAKAKTKLAFQHYVEFIKSKDSKVRAIDDLESRKSYGVPMVEFAPYILALLNANGFSSTGGQSEWALSEIILLSQCGMRGYMGHKMSWAQLKLGLEKMMSSDQYKQFVKEREAQIAAAVKTEEEKKAKAAANAKAAQAFVSEQGKSTVKKDKLG